MRRPAFVFILSLALLVGLGVDSPKAEAQPSCPEGTLVGDSCQVEGDAPVSWAYRCPALSDGSFCYELVPRSAVGSCPPNTINDRTSDMCRLAVALVSPGLTCLDGRYEVVGERCIRFVDPVCGPNGCGGKITLAYTVDCVRDGVARVTLGQPVLVNGARISFITVNGSAIVGADLPAGTAVMVVVTPERLNDEVILTGPTIAPACGSTAPTPTPPPPTATPTPPPTERPAPQPTTPPTTLPTAAPTPPTTNARMRILEHVIGPCDGDEFRLTIVSAVEPTSAAQYVQWTVDGVDDEFALPVGRHIANYVGDGETHVFIASGNRASDIEPDVLVLDFPNCIQPTEPTPSPTSVPAATPIPANTTSVAVEPSSTALPVSETATGALPVTSTNLDVPLLPLIVTGAVTAVVAIAATVIVMGQRRRP